jgi:hypothetical protein
MANVEIGTMDTTIEFEPEVITAGAPGAVAGAAGTAGDALRLRELLRPVILELLEEELATYSRMRG